MAKKLKEARRGRKEKQKAKEKAKFLSKDSPKVKYASEMNQLGFIFVSSGEECICSQ